MQIEIDQIIDSIKSGNMDYNEQELIRLSNQLIDGDFDQKIVHSFLELGHFPQINNLFYKSEYKNQWFETLVTLINKSEYHTGILLRQRAERYSEKPLFKIISGKQINNVTYSEVWQLVKTIGSALIKITNGIKQPVIGIYMPNSLETVLIDLACLSFNFKIIPIPANVSKEHLEYILKHSGINYLFIDGTDQINQFKKIENLVSELKVIELSRKMINNSISWKNFIEDIDFDNQLLDEKLGNTKMNSDSTVMYTSGTTANPKGIIFNQTNIITKRFARALALPNLNSDDVFLCYLPLYHTFGRYLELMGSIFWGATYCFAESPSFKSLRKNFKLVQPSIFISIPKRWFQFYEMATGNASISDESEVRKNIIELTGGKLRLGLSAAGYLDPDVFAFYQENGIQLLSGYGMTEATGGITMTPENDYVKDSVGKALPGIKLKLGEDNELLLQGSYIINRYHQDTDKSAYKDGWFHTGDIFEEHNGHYFIVDRKKDIYKNSRGITISPQKIENLFQDFDAVKSVFLVGDGKPYNTVLIYPDKDWLSKLEFEKDISITDYFSSLIQSVNSFLATYERIVNFTLVDRDFSNEFGELTPKKTFKRKKILENFAKIIDPLYEQDYNSWLIEGIELRIPKWLLRKSGLIVNDVKWKSGFLTVRNSDKKISIRKSNKNIIIGDYEYSISNDFIDFRNIVLSPELWLGNIQFVDFFSFSNIIPKSIEQPTSIYIDDSTFHFRNLSVTNDVVDKIKTALREKNFSLETLHNAAIVLFNGSQYNLLTAINYLSKAISNDQPNIADIALSLLKRLRYDPEFKNRVKTLEVITPFISGKLFIEYLIEIYSSSNNPKILKDIALDIRLLKNSHFKSILQKLADFRHSDRKFISSDTYLVEALLNTITEYGIGHPTEYKWSRSELIKWSLLKDEKYLSDLSNSLTNKMIIGFRDWLGQNKEKAIDRDIGEEYTWLDVIVFDPNVNDKFKPILIDAISHTAMLKEAVFLLHNFKIIDLDDIQNRGVWIMLLGHNHGKSVFRVTVQTRDYKSYNFVINYSEEIPEKDLLNEVKWLITTGSSSKGTKLVEDFGGCWPKYNLFTEEYIQGETLYQYLERNKKLIADPKQIDTWQLKWMHYIWNSLMAYFSFYARTNFKLYIKNASTRNLIIPEFDYAIGTLLISISDKAELKSILNLFTTLYNNLIVGTEKQYKGLPHVADWEIIFCALLQTVTVKKGIEILIVLGKEIGSKTINGLNKKKIANFIDEINDNGLLTKQVVFAALRYERWLDLNPDASLSARNTMVRQLYMDYNLSELITDYPETRIRYFLMTAFKDSDKSIREELNIIKSGLRAKTILPTNLEDKINTIIKNFKPNEDDKYFLSRLIFEHIDNIESGKEFVWKSDKEGKIELITGLVDSFGENHQIRQAAHPKEIAKFQSLLLNSNLSAIFNDQHEFLLLFNSNNQLIGGVYWKNLDNNIAYLERIVIHPNYRKRYLSSHLLDEMFNRLKNKRYTHVTVGYFQAGLFYNKGFHIDKQFGGLVKKLN